MSHPRLLAQRSDEPQAPFADLRAFERPVANQCVDRRGAKPPDATHASLIVRRQYWPAGARPKSHSTAIVTSSAPGVTGWAQVHQGNVAEINAATGKLRYDFFYIKYFSPWLDLLISAKTVGMTITGFGSR